MPSPINVAFYAAVVVLFVLVIRILILAEVSSLQGFLADHSSLIEDLEKKGWKDIKILKHSWFLIPLRGGEKDDVVRFEILAKNPAGKKSIFYIYAKIKDDL